MRLYQVAVHKLVSRDLHAIFLPNTEVTIPEQPSAGAGTAKRRYLPRCFVALLLVALSAAALGGDGGAMGAAGTEVAGGTREAGRGGRALLRTSGCLSSVLRLRRPFLRIVRGAGPLLPRPCFFTRACRAGANSAAACSARSFSLARRFSLLGELAGGAHRLGSRGRRWRVARSAAASATSCFQVEARDLDLGDVSLDELLVAASSSLFSGLTGDLKPSAPARPVRPMRLHVVPRPGGHVVVHHVGHLVDVDAAGPGAVARDHRSRRR